jgi:MtN3 and saliva related transmembrane protein
MFSFLVLSIIGISATIFSVSSTMPQIIKGIRTKKMDDVSTWLIITLIVGLSLWIVYGIAKSDLVIAGGNSVGVSFNVILLILKVKYSQKPISQMP